MVGVGGRVCVGDWEGDGGGGFTEMKVFALLSFVCLYVYIFLIFDKKGRLPIRNMNPKTLNFQKKTSITHSEFNKKTHFLKVEVGSFSDKIGFSQIIKV